MYRRLCITYNFLLRPLPAKFCQNQHDMVSSSFCVCILADRMMQDVKHILIVPPLGVGGWVEVAEFDSTAKAAISSPLLFAPRPSNATAPACASPISWPRREAENSDAVAVGAREAVPNERKRISIGVFIVVFSVFLSMILGIFYQLQFSAILYHLVIFCFERRWLK